MLQSKSITELRGIAQSMGIADVFQLDKAHLIQEIDLKKSAVNKPAPVSVVNSPYDARLMAQAPGKIADKDEAMEALQPYVAAGLHVSMDNERWYFKHGKKSDEGTLRMPLRTILKCAEAVLR